MTKNCIICGSPVHVTGNPEIVSCDNNHCLLTVENSIGLHYQTGKKPVDEFAGTITFKGGEITKIELRPRT